MWPPPPFWQTKHCLFFADQECWGVHQGGGRTAAAKPCGSHVSWEGEVANARSSNSPMQSEFLFLCKFCDKKYGVAVRHLVWPDRPTPLSYSLCWGLLPRGKGLVVGAQPLVSYAVSNKDNQVLNDIHENWINFLWCCLSNGPPCFWYAGGGEPLSFTVVGRLQVMHLTY